MTASLAYGGPWVPPEDVDVLIDLEKVAELVNQMLGDETISCYVEQTGGGTATIYLGRCYHRRWGTHELVPDATGDEPELDYYRPVLGGPGHFQGAAWTMGRAYPGEFSIGYDQDYPDVTVDGWELDLAYGPHAHSPYSGERVIAQRMVRLYRDHPLVKAGEVR